MLAWKITDQLGRANHRNANQRVANRPNFQSLTFFRKRKAASFYEARTRRSLRHRWAATRRAVSPTAIGIVEERHSADYCVAMPLTCCDVLRGIF